MRLTLPRMISPSSLSAFSAAVAGPGVNGRVSGVAPVQQARAQSSGPPVSVGAAQANRPSPDAAPGRPLPRGSLLDLSV